MIVDVEFKENNTSFDADFGEIQTASDGGYEKGYDIGYGAGKKDGISEGREQGYQKGFAAANAELNALLAVAPFLRKAEPIYEKGYEGDAERIKGWSGFLMGKIDGYHSYAIVLPWVTEMPDFATDDFWYIYAVIFTSKTPPTIGWQGLWSSDGGCCPPGAIFVPDESIDAYKSTTNLAEFAHLIKPLSEYDGEGYSKYDDGWA